MAKNETKNWVAQGIINTYVYNSGASSNYILIISCNNISTVFALKTEEACRKISNLVEFE